MMRELLRRLREACLRRPIRLMKVACVQPLAAGVTLYAIDIDGRRLVIGACAGSVCLLESYPLPGMQASAAAGAATASA